MGGSKGFEARYASQAPNLGLAKINAEQNALNSPALAQLLASYGTGGTSYQDAIKAASGLTSNTSAIDKRLGDLQSNYDSSVRNLNWIRDEKGSDEDKRQRENEMLQAKDQLAQAQAERDAQLSLGPNLGMDQLALGTGTGYKLASDQVMNNPLYAGLFGDTGLQNQSQKAYLEGLNALSGKDSSYGLTPEDLAAYGQSSDNIARMFGAQGNNLAESLAARGLGTGQSGAVNQAFSGLMGNQAEQLAQSQRAIAQNRINTAMGLAQAKTGAASNMVQGLGMLGTNAQQQAYNQNLQGIMGRQGMAKDAAGLGMQQADTNQNMLNEFFAQQAATRKASFGEKLGDAVASIPSAVAGGLAGGIGKSAGENIFGKSTPGKST